MNYIPEEVVKAYSEPHRRFHTMEHIYSMLEYCGLERPGHNPELFHAILWHDFVYVPGALDNEEKSAEAWLKFNKENDCYIWDNCGDEDDFNVGYVAELILSTKTPFVEHDTYEKKMINLADFGIFEQSEKELIEYEKQIFYEFQKYSLDKYKEGRSDFLLDLLCNCTRGGIKQKNVKFLINYVKNKEYKIGVYAGSFNPFHIGHQDIIKQAEAVFDQIIQKLFNSK